MIASLMVYVLIASLLLAIGGWGLESLLRSVRHPTRFVWIAVLLGTTVLAIAAPLRVQRSEEMPTQGLVAVEMRASQTDAVSGSDLPVEPTPSSLSQLREGVRSVLGRPITLAARFEGERGGVVLGVAWGVLSLILLGVGSATAIRYRSARKSWPIDEIEGVRVRVAPTTGPAVMGILRPEIVVPKWLLASTPEERRLAILHEREHLRARDGFLLVGGCAVVALLPWNPLAWWMLSRLRLAIEVDCDARVLRHGIEQRFYGAMLIDVSGHSSGLSLGSPALAGLPSHLERRLRAMTMKRSTGALLRGSAVGVVGMVAVLAACDASMPTAAEIEAMDAESAVEGLVRTGLIAPGQVVEYTVDGAPATEEEVRAIAAEEIVGISVARQGLETPGAPTRVRIDTRSFRDAMEPSERRGLAPQLPEDQQPLYLIDNVPATAAEFNSLNPADIQTVSLLKDAAAAVYGYRAANGVVLVVTKGAAARREQMRQEDPVSYEQLMNSYTEGYGIGQGTATKAPSEEEVLSGEEPRGYEYFIPLAPSAIPPDTIRIPLAPSAVGTEAPIDASGAPQRYEYYYVPPDTTRIYLPAPPVDSPEGQRDRDNDESTDRLIRSYESIRTLGYFPNSSGAANTETAPSTNDPEGWFPSLPWFSW